MGHSIPCMVGSPHASGWLWGLWLDQGTLQEGGPLTGRGARWAQPGSCGWGEAGDEWAPCTAPGAGAL